MKFGQKSRVLALMKKMKFCPDIAGVDWIRKKTIITHACCYCFGQLEAGQPMFFPQVAGRIQPACVPCICEMQALKEQEARNPSAS